MTQPVEGAGRRARLERLRRARMLSDELFDLVRPEAMWDRPIDERHRILFYLGHLEAFDWNMIGRRSLGLKPFNGEFDHLFEFGIDPVDGDLPSDRPSDWPPLAAIRDYNRVARDTLDAHLAEPDRAPPGAPYLADGLIVEVALEHRLMHVETLQYMLHRLPYDRKVAGPVPAYPGAAPPAAGPERVEVPRGVATLGRARGSGFGWDNEFEETAVEVEPFAIDAYPVTNGRFLEFVEAGGYQEAALWTPGDWTWIKEAGVAHPGFWVRRGDGYALRGLFGEAPLPRDWPVYVSHAEASAYARWRAAELPSEGEWHRAVYGTPAGDERPYPWGPEPPDPSRGNFDLVRHEPAPVTAHPRGASAFGVHDALGNGWEWTRTPFAPLPGFEAFPFYPGYSASFFDGKHFVMKGGSARTAACMLRRSFRNWFQPHYPHVYAKFRCVTR